MRLRGAERPGHFYRYLTVGATAFLTDFGLFNAVMILGFLFSLSLEPFGPKAFSILISIGVSYTLHSKWTFAGAAELGDRRQIIRHLVTNGLALLVTILPLFISRQLLGLNSLLADNISTSIFGVGFAAILRYLLSRFWVFTR